MISAVILAAGESRRMGKKNKLLLRIGKEALLVKLVKAVCASDVGQVLVVIGHEAEKIRLELNDFPLSFVNNYNFSEGMTSSIKEGIKEVSQNSDGLLICLADMPYINTSEINKLIHAFVQNRIKEKKLIVVPVFQGQRGNPVLFSIEFRNDILDHKKESGCKGVIKNHSESVMEIPMDNDNILIDVDNLEDFQRVSKAFVN
mgnify:CR=1 FL=1|tara:strand:+ start:237 stop:842 length:606 start_codon:yes stop_codon:yes gene_type:complete